MDKKTTPPSVDKKKVAAAETSGTPHVSEKTLAFLRLFASSYFVEKELPQSLQGIILG